MCLKKALLFPTYYQCHKQLISNCSHTNFHPNPCKDACSIFYPLFLLKSCSQKWLYFRSQCTWGGVMYLYVDVEIPLPWIMRASWEECCHNWCFVPRVGGTGNEQKLAEAKWNFNTKEPHLPHRSMWYDEHSEVKRLARQPLLSSVRVREFMHLVLKAAT